MPTIAIQPATADRFDAAERALNGGGDGAECQCQWWTIPNSDWQRTSRDEREEMLRDEMSAGPPPGLIAYVDGEPAGWVRVGPRTAQVRIGRTRDIVAHTTEPLDDPRVWSVSCFVVRREYRLLGLNAELLEAAVDFARRSGARVVEAYPYDPTVKKRSANELYRGVLSVFQGAGFREIARPKADRTIVALDLG